MSIYTHEPDDDEDLTIKELLEKIGDVEDAIERLEEKISQELAEQFDQEQECPSCNQLASAVEQLAQYVATMNKVAVADVYYNPVFNPNNSS